MFAGEARRVGRAGMESRPVAAQFQDDFRCALHIADGHAHPARFIHHFREAARQIGNHRHHACAHGLQQTERQPLEIREQHEHVEVLQQSRHLLVRHRVHEAHKWKLLQRRAQFLALRAFAHDGKFHRHAPRLQLLCQRRQTADALLLLDDSPEINQPQRRLGRTRRARHGGGEINAVGNHLRAHAAQFGPRLEVHANLPRHAHRHVRPRRVLDHRRVRAGIIRLHDAHAQHAARHDAEDFKTLRGQTAQHGARAIPRHLFVGPVQPVLEDHFPPRQNVNRIADGREVSGVGVLRIQHHDGQLLSAPPERAREVHEERRAAAERQAARHRHERRGRFHAHAARRIQRLCGRVCPRGKKFCNASR